MNRHFVILILALVFASACGKKATRTQETLTTEQTPADFLAAVPPDTPYVMAAMEPLPLNVLSPWFASVQQSLGVTEQELHDLMVDEYSDAGTRAVAYFSHDISTNFSREGLEERGLSWSPRIAVYGIGLLPAMRLELSDPQKFDEYLKTIETETGLTRRVEQLGEKSLWSYDLADEDTLLVMAISGRSLLAGITNRTAAPRFVEVLLGDGEGQSPSPKAAELTEVASTWGFKLIGVGMIDLQRIAQMLFAPEEGLNQEIVRALELELDASQACRDETLAMARKAPRLVFGYETWTPQESTFTMALELPDGLGAQLAEAKTSVPLADSAGAENSAMFAGFGADLGALLEIVRTRLDAVREAPFQCHRFAPLNRAAEELSMASMLIPPLVRQVRGASAVVSDLVEVEAPTVATPPDQPVDPNMETAPREIVHGVLTVVTPSPRALFDFAKSHDEKLATVEVQPNGVPVPLPESELLSRFEFPQIVMIPQALAFTSGESVPPDLNQRLQQEQSSPLILFSIDVDRFMKDSPAAEAMVTSAIQVELDPTPAGVLVRTKMPLTPPTRSAGEDVE